MQHLKAGLNTQLVIPPIVYLVKGGTGEEKDGEFLDGVIGVLAQLDVGVPVCTEGEVRRPVRLIKTKIR